MATKVYFDSDEENEVLFGGHGANITVTFLDASHATYWNVTEIHWLYPTPVGKRVALESDIHCTGNTIDIERIANVVIQGSKVKHENF